MSVMLVFLLFALWSSVFAIGKATLFFAPPLFLTAVRMVIAGILMTGVLAIWKRKSLRFSKKQFLSIALLGFFSIYLANICEFWGLQYLSAAKTCFLYSLSPFFTAIFSYIHFGEKMNTRKALGLLIGFAGFFPVLMLQSGSEGLSQIFSGISLPDLAVAGAALFAVYGWILLRLIVKDQDVAPSSANGVSMLIGGGLALAHSLIIDPWHPTPIAAGHIGNVAIGVGLMTLVSNVICYNLYGHMLKRFTATFLSFAGLLSPIFASLSGWLILGEKPNPVIFLSTGIILFGLWIVYHAELKQGYIKKRSHDLNKDEAL